MKFRICIFVLAFLVFDCSGLTYYEYYGTGDNTGLVAEGDTFKLNGKDITIFSGAFHYFRVHPSYWRDTLRKLRAAGLNTVETYMPWNLHNPRQDVFDFGDLGEDMSSFLNLERFIQLAQEEDLFVILRPGPYICAEWEFGGMPSWLLRDPTMHLRTYYEGYRTAITGYYQNVTSIVVDKTFQKGGPLIAIQIENEYGHFGYDDIPRDKLYLQFIRDLLDTNGMSEVLYLTSDTPSDTLDWGGLPNVLMTANFNTNVKGNLDTLKMLQPNRPLMVMEYWTGWFDHWLQEIHVSVPTNQTIENLEAILNMSSSVNFYMFIGGTNFGFMAGANMVEGGSTLEYTPIVTSYDYDAPLTEAGDYTTKYDAIRNTITAYNPLNGVVSSVLKPSARAKYAYGSFEIQEAIEFQDLSDLFKTKFDVTNGPVNMEALDINNGNGQSYGYILYNTSLTLAAGNSTLLIRGHVRDMAQVLVNGVVKTPKYRVPIQMNNFGFWNGLDQELTFEVEDGLNTIQILVENLGRVNYGRPHFFNQKKGLWEGPILVDQKQVDDWTITPMEFKKSFINNDIQGWQSSLLNFTTPSLYRVKIQMDGGLLDTFLDMSDWGKGVVFLNGFNLGRYWSVGPTKTLYVPAPLLKSGENEFVVFEQYESASSLTFIDFPKLGLLSKNNLKN